MKRYTSDKVFRIAVLLIIGLLGSAAARAQSLLPSLGPQGELIFPDESPEELLSYGIGDSEVDFFLLGDWEASAALALGSTWLPLDSGGYRRISYPPLGMSSRPLTNTVDLLVSLWVDNRFFFESSFQSGFSDNSILAGYYGDGLLRELKLGNTTIGMSEYPLLNIGDGATGSPGLSLSLAGEKSLHEFFIRYDSSSRRVRTFSGTNEYSTESIHIDEYIRGKHFLLPDRNPEAVELWLESSRFETGYGDISASDEYGSWYRRLVPAEDYGIDSARAEVTLSADLPAGRLVIYYEKAGSPVGDQPGEIPIADLAASQQVGTDLVTFSWSSFETAFIGPLEGILGLETGSLSNADYQRSIGGGPTSLVLYEPGLFSPFEIRAVYLDGGFSRLELQDAAGPKQNLTIRRSPSGIRILPGSAADPLSQPWKIRYPLLDMAGSEIGRYYGPGEIPYASSINRFRLSAISEENSGIRIDESMVPGSLQVFINGQTSDDFSIDNGEVVFSRPVSDLDDITLLYRSLEEGAGGGTIVAGQGNRMSIGDFGNLDIAVAGSIATEPGEFSRSPGENPGYVQLSTSYAYNNANLDLTIEAGAGLFSADTRLEFRPLYDGVDDWSPAMPFPGVLPSALPNGQALETASGGLIPAANISNLGGRRGSLRFRDYRSDFRGFLLTRDAFSSEPDLVEQAAGPYPILASTDDPVSGAVAALEFDLSAGSWSGYQYSPGDPPGLIQGLELYILAEEVSAGPLQLALEFGALSEDSDGDNVLDSQASPEDLGYVLSLDSGDLIAGYPGREYRENWEPVSEDINGDGILNRANRAANITRYLGQIDTASDVWQKYEIQFSDLEISRVPELPSLRLVLYSDAASQGRILVSRASFTRTPLSVNGAGGRVRETANSSYEVRWDSRPGEAATLLYDLGASPMGMYGLLEVPLSQLSGGAGQISVEINSTALGSLSPGALSGDVTLGIDLENNLLLLRDPSGEIVQQVDFSASLPSGDLRYLGLRFTEGAAGSLVTGTPRFSRPASSIRGSFAADMEYRPQGWVLAEQTPFEVRLRRVRFSGGYQSGGFDQPAGVDSRALIDGRFGFSEVLFDSAFFFPTDGTISRDIEQRIIANPINGLTIRDSYRQAASDGGVRHERGAGITVSLGEAGDAGIDYSLSQDEANIQRGWNSSLDYSRNIGEADADNPSSRLGLRSSLQFSINEALEGPTSLSGNEAPDYFAGYAASLLRADWRLSESPDFTRQTEITLAPAIQVGRLDFSPSLALSTGYQSLPEATFNGGLTQDVSVGLDITPDSGISISFDQDHGISEFRETGGFFDDMGRAAAQIQAIHGIAVPRYVFGIFQDELDNQLITELNQSQAIGSPWLLRHEQRAGINFWRTPGSKLLDIVHPAGVSLSIDRAILWESGIVSDVRELESVVSWQAVNLFGSLGRYGGLNFYRSDEWFFEQRLRSDIDTRDDWLLSFILEPVLYEPWKASSLTNRLSADFASRGPVPWRISLHQVLTWVVPLNREGALSRFIEERSSLSEELRLENKESLEISFSGLRPGSPGGQNLITSPPGVSVDLSHRSALQFSELGSLSLGIRARYENRAIEDINYRFSHTLGVELDALLKLSY